MLYHSPMPSAEYILTKQCSITSEAQRWVFRNLTIMEE
jgi:hypothetical protein